MLVFLIPYILGYKPHLFYLNICPYFSCGLYAEHTTRNCVFPWTRNVWEYYAVRASKFREAVAVCETFERITHLVIGGKILHCLFVWLCIILAHTVLYATEYIIKKVSLYEILLYDKSWPEFPSKMPLTLQKCSHLVICETLPFEKEASYSKLRIINAYYELAQVNSWERLTCVTTDA